MPVDLGPYAARLAGTWRARFGQSRLATVDGTLASVDLSGFTRLGERLARAGRGGAEELNRVINEMWTGLVPCALVEGGDILQFGGDALLVLFDGVGTEARAARSTLAMQHFVRRHGRVDTPAGPVRLGMSVGLHSDTYHLYVVGNTHRELMVAGPAATTTVRLESRAARGEVLVSDAVAQALPRGCTLPVGEGAHRLRRAPAPDTSPPSNEHPNSTTAGGPRTAEAASGFVPHQVLEIVNAGVLPGEHRQVTVAFVKPDDLDTVLVRHGPTAVLDRLDRVAAAIDEAVERFDVCWLATDVAPNSATFLLTTGAPRAGEADEERMLRALRSVLDACPDLGLRIGVNRGRAFAAGVGHPQRQSYTVLGDTTNLAARLAARAEPGTILASQTVLDRCATPFANTPQEPFFVKGKRVPIEAAVVGRMTTSRAPTPPGPSDAGGPAIVGRAAELDLIATAWQKAIAGSGGAVEIVAEPGTGKSTLVEAALRPVRVAGHRVVWFRGHLYEGLHSYFAVCDGLRTMLGIPLDASAAVAGRALVALVEHAAPELRAWVPLVAVTIDAVTLTTDETRRLDPAHVQRRRHAAVVDLLRVVTSGPTVMGAEDVHLFDDASRELLRVIVDAAVGQPWLVVATRRPGPEEPALLSGAGAEPRDSVQTVVLEPLDEHDAVQLALMTAGEHALRDDVLERLVIRAAGNPLFLQELVNAHRVFVGDGDLPESIERVLTARIDHLRPADRALLRQAAVLGSTVDLRLLAHVLGEPAVRDPARWTALADFVDFVAAPAAIRFRHDLVRAASYEGLAERRRRQIHASVVDVLERSDPPPVDLLALHAAAGHRHADAWRWTLAAAERAEARCTLVEAAEHLERALDAASHVAGLSVPEVAATAERLGDIHERLGRYDPAMQAYRRAQQGWSGDPVAEARMLRKRGRVAEKTGNYVQSLRYVGRGFRRLETAGAGNGGVVDLTKVTATRCELALTRALARYWQGRAQEAVDWARRALGSAIEIDDTRLQAQAHLQLEMALSDLGSPERAEHGEQAMALFEAIGDDIGLGNTLLNVGVSEYNEGRWDSSLARYERAAAAYRRAGHVTASAHPVNNQAEILTDQGRIDDAEDRLRTARRMYRSTGYAMGVALTTSGLSRLALRRGDFARAHELLDAAMLEFEALGAGAFLLDTKVRRVETLVFEGRAVDAMVLADELTVALGKQSGVPLLPITVLRLRALALWTVGSAEAALAELDRALALARRDGARFEIALCLHTAAAIDTARGITVSDPVIAERDEVLASLGVVVVPGLPEF